jgi:hypothetical protein
LTRVLILDLETKDLKFKVIIRVVEDESFNENFQKWIMYLQIFWQSSKKKPCECEV